MPLYLVENNYNWIDEAPQPNYNYYRVNSIYANGHSAYSKIVKVWTGQNEKLVVYPNPSINGNVQIHFGAAPSGVYKLRLLNQAGQLMLAKDLKHEAGSASEIITLNKNIVPGLYTLEILASDGTKTTSSISIFK